MDPVSAVAAVLSSLSQAGVFSGDPNPELLVEKVLSTVAGFFGVSVPVGLLTSLVGKIGDFLRRHANDPCPPTQDDMMALLSGVTTLRTSEVDARGRPVFTLHQEPRYTPDDDE